MDVRKIANRFSSYLCTQVGQPELCPTISYGLELILGESIKMLILLLIAYGFNLLAPTIFIILAAVPLRVLTGGNHCTSHLRCLLFTLISFPLLAYSAQQISLLLHGIFLFSFAFFSTILITITLETYGLGYSINFPETISRPIDKYKNYTFLFLFVWLVAILIFTYFFGDSGFLATFVISTSLGVLWQAFMLTPLGHHFVAAVDRCFKLFNKTE